MNPLELAEIIAKSRELELSSSHLQALCLLTAEPLKQTELADHLVLSTAAVTGIVDRLEQLGFAERRFNRASHADRRVVRIGITHQGVSALDEILNATATAH